MTAILADIDFSGVTCLLGWHVISVKGNLLLTDFSKSITLGLQPNLLVLAILLENIFQSALWKAKSKAKFDLEKFERIAVE